MGSKSTIEWTDASWTPIRATVRPDAREIAVSKGYSTLVNILDARNSRGNLRTPPGKVGPHCERVSKECDLCYSEANNGRCLPSNGTGLPFTRPARDLVQIAVDENILRHPLMWTRARRIFVCSQTDLFAAFVPIPLITRVFHTMSGAPWHTYQVLTKRPERMLTYALNHTGWFPAPWLWCGVSVGTRAALPRIDILRKVPAAVRFLSVEPLLEDLGELDLTGIHWVIIGGESGVGCRPMAEEWAARVIAQCEAAGVPVFFKQWGGRRPKPATIGGREYRQMPNPEIVPHCDLARIRPLLEREGV